MKKTIINIVMTLAVLFQGSVIAQTTGDQVIKSRGTVASYRDISCGVNEFGIPVTMTVLDITTYLTNNTNKTLSKIFFSVYYRDKRSDPFDVTASCKVEYSDATVDIPPYREAEVKFSNMPPDDINLVYKHAKIERLVYSDGSFVDF